MFLDIDKKDAQSVAVIDDSKRVLTYGDISAFVQNFPVNERSLAFLLSENTMGSVLGYCAMLSKGIVPLIVSNKTEESLLNNLLNLYRPQYIWVPEGRNDIYGNVLFKSYGYVLIETDDVSPSMNKDLSLLLPTSGSTGSPKLVRHSYRNIEANAENVAHLFQIKKNDRAMAVLPMHYTMGLSVVTSHLYAGATVLLSEKSLLDKNFWDFLKEGKATSFTGVPYSYEILDKIRFYRMDLPDLEIITQGGGRLSDSLFEKLAKYAEDNGKLFIPTYGQTECTARMAYLPWPKSLEKTGSIGFAEPGGVLTIVDDSGNETYEGEAVGEMVYRGENVTMGYAECREDLMKGDENNGVMFTGDIAKRDKDGCYYIIGRKKRFLKIYGLRIGLDEVERMVKDNFGVDCLCYGDDTSLIVKVTDGKLSEAISSLIEQKTHIYHNNIKVEIVDSLNRNEVGKVILNK